MPAWQRRILLAVMLISALNCGATKSAVTTRHAKEHIRTLNLAITQHNFSLFRDSMTTEFMKMGINVIDRNHVEKVLQEYAFNQAGLTDPKTRKDLGKFLGASAIAILEFTPGDWPQANVQVIDVESGSILISASYAFRGGFVPNHVDVTEIIGKEIRAALDD